MELVEGHRLVIAAAGGEAISARSITPQLLG